MQLVSAAGIATCLALLSFPLCVDAQFTENQNITLRFLQSSQGDSCDYGNSSSVLTFTTQSIPIISHCFNFADLFGGNATQGFVNQSRNTALSESENAGIHWQLQNMEKYDKQANYSRILYRQHVASPSRDDFKPGHYADRSVTVYGGSNCTEKDPSSNDRTTPLLPWYGFSCWSESKGSCGNLPYTIASFSIQSGKDKNQDGTCWAFAKMGAAAPIYSSSQAAMWAFVGPFLTIWMTL